MIELGALDFIPKPINKDKVNEVLDNYGVLEELIVKKNLMGLSEELMDLYREITNVSMGEAGELLGKFLNVPVTLSIPIVNTLNVYDLHKTLLSNNDNHTFTALTQGFIGDGISGEALLIFDDSCFKEVAELLHFNQEIDDNLEQELIIDISSILIGASLKSIGKQLAIDFSQGYPTLLGQHSKIRELIRVPKDWIETLSIQISYKISDHNINCDLLFLFSEKTVPKLNEKISCLL
ncbi:MAG: response regulator [Pseudomonadota bacterium]